MQQIIVLETISVCLGLRRRNLFLAPPGSGGFAGAGTVFRGCPPANQLSPEIRPHVTGPSPVERASSEVNIYFRYCSPASGSLPEIQRLLRTHKNKQKRRELTLGAFAYSSICICRPRGPTFVEKTICVLVSPKRCRSVMNSSSSIVLEKNTFNNIE